MSKIKTYNEFIGDRPKSIAENIKNYAEEAELDELFGTVEINREKKVPYDKQLWFPNEDSQEQKFESTDSDEEELSMEEKKRRTEKSLSLAQQNSSPTYFNYVTNKTEVTPSVNTRKQALSNIKKEAK